MREVKTERTGWRDMNLSQRHRQWGWDCPAVDLDFLFLEYDKGKAVALVEYKHEKASPQFAQHPTYQAMVDLGNRASIPVLCARYANDFSWWKITPLNSFAMKWVPERTELDEKGWVTLLYKIRGYELPKEVLKNWDVEL